MRNVARLPDSDRGELFRNTADKMGLNDAIVEKDFWVCFTLKEATESTDWVYDTIRKICGGDTQ